VSMRTSTIDRTCANPDHQRLVAEMTWSKVKQGALSFISAVSFTICCMFLEGALLAALICVLLFISVGIIPVICFTLIIIVMLAIYTTSVCVFNLTQRAMKRNVESATSGGDEVFFTYTISNQPMKQENDCACAGNEDKV
jgi:hypothetical protein